MAVTSEIIEVKFDVNEQSLKTGLNQAQSIIDTFSKNSKVDLKFDVDSSAIKETQAAFKGVTDSATEAADSVSNYNNETKNADSSFIVKTIAKWVSLTAAIVLVAKAIHDVIAASWDYNVQMENSTVKLQSMISASKAYVTTTGQAVTSQERNLLILKETNETMELIKEANYKTALSTKELIDVYALMKPGMDKTNVSLKDQIELLTLSANTAVTFGLGAEELASGIDDLATGTWEAASGFGKMMKNLGLTADQVKNSTDAVGLLKDAMRETGAAQDTWAVAVSSFNDKWDDLTADITKPIFEPLKRSLKDITALMGTHGVKAAEAFGSGLKEFAKMGASVIGFVVKAVVELISILQIAGKGYQMLAEAAGWAGGKIAQGFGAMEEWMYKAGMLDPVYKNAGEAMQEAGKKAQQSSLDNIASLDKEVVAITARNDAAIAGIDNITGAFKTYVAETEAAGPLQIGPDLEGVELAKKAVKGAIKAEKDLTKAKAKGVSDRKKITDKAAKDAKKAADKVAKDVKKAAEKMQKDLEDIGKGTAKSISDALGKGDILGAVESLGEGIQDTLSKSFDITDISGSFDGLVTAFSGMSASLDATIASSVWGLILTVGLKAIQEFFSGATVSAQELDQAEGITGIQSDTVANSLTNLEQDSMVGLEYSKQMVQSLQTLVNASDSAAANIGLDYSGTDYVPRDKAGFWSDRTTDLLSTGIMLDSKTIDQLTEGGVTGRGYTKELVKDSGWLGIGGGESISTRLTGDIEDNITDPITEAYLAGGEAIKEAAEAFGISGEEFNTQVADWTTSFSQLNFEGKSEEEIADMINGVIGADMDAMAEMLIEVTPYIQEFSAAGEGSAETMIRLVGEYEQVDMMFQMMGMDMLDLTDGGIQLSQGLIDAAGGMDALQASLSFFLQNFFTDAERVSFQTSILTNEFRLLGEVLPTTRDEYQKLVIAELENASAAAIATDAAWNLVVATEALSAAEYQAAVDKWEIAKAEQDLIDKKVSDLLELGPMLDSIFSYNEGLASEAASTINSMNSVSSSMDGMSSSMNGMSSSMNGMSSSCSAVSDEADRAAEAAEKLAEQLMTVAESLSFVGIVTEFDEALMEGAGGFSAFNSAMTTFTKQFLTTTEQIDIMTMDLTMQFESLGLALPKTNDEFKALLLTLDVTTEAGAKMFGELLAMSKDFSSLSSAIAKEQKAIAEAKKAAGEAYDKAALAASKTAEEAAKAAAKLALELDQVSNSMVLLGIVTQFNETLMDAAGGLSNFNSAMKTYTSNFFTITEQVEMQIADLDREFESLGITNMPETNAEYRRMLENLDVTTEAGSELFGEILSLAGAFNTLTKAMEKQEEEAKQSIQNIADAWVSNLSYLTLQQKADYATAYLKLGTKDPDSISVVQAAKTAAEYAMKTATTKEDYIPAFDKYIKTLENEKPANTLDNVVEELRVIAKEVQELQDITTVASYRSA